jgi:hypothetical protein
MKTPGTIIDETEEHCPAAYRNGHIHKALGISLPRPTDAERLDAYRYVVEALLQTLVEHAEQRRDEAMEAKFNDTRD